MSEERNMGEFLHFRGLGKLMKEGKYQTQLQFMIPSPSNNILQIIIIFTDAR